MTSPTLVLAGNHQQYVEFLKTRGINPYIQQSASGMRFYEGGGQVAGVHFSRIVVTGTFRERADARNLFEYSRACLEIGGRIAYDDLEHGWYANKWDVNGDPVMHDAEGVLRCNWCRSRCSETYRGGVCYSCKEQIMPSGIKSSGLHKVHPSPFKSVYGDPDDKPLLMMPKLKIGPQPPYVGHQEGDIWQLPRSSSPMWTDQWAYQGSAKAPYIISKRQEGHENGSVTKDGWACSCMAFTRNTPRTPCKHILNVMLKFGLGAVAKASAKMANVDDAKLKEFEKWRREQATLKKDNNPTAGAKLNLFGTTTRKFR